MAEELSGSVLLQTSSEILLPEMCRAPLVAFAKPGLKKISFSINFLLLIWVYATAVNSVVVLFADLFY